MATVSASHFVSRGLIVHGSVTHADARTNLAELGLRNQPMTHNGLRAVNKMDIRANSKAITKMHSKRKGQGVETCRPSGTVIKGMQLLFLASEVTPWSKTGGLGDVLGGLPPAMAVRDCHSLSFAS